MQVHSQQSQITLTYFTWHTTTHSPSNKKDHSKTFGNNHTFHSVTIGSSFPQALAGVKRGYNGTADHPHTSLQLLHILHRPPSITREPGKFPSYSLGSLNAQALQEAVDKTLEKGVVEINQVSISAFYIRWFLVEKALSR